MRTSENTRDKIISVSTRMFLENGYSTTNKILSIADGLNPVGFLQASNSPKAHNFIVFQACMLQAIKV